MGGLAGGLDPDCRGWREVVAGGFNAVDEINALLSQRARCVDDFADTVEVVIVAAEVGDAVPAIWAGEVQN